MYILYAEYAGAGKHIYNLTYHEYYVFDKVIPSRSGSWKTSER